MCHPLQGRERHNRRCLLPRRTFISGGLIVLIRPHSIFFFTFQLHEEHELVWDDGVAAEAALDYDAPFISAADGLKMWLGGFAFFASIYGLVWMSDPESRRQAVPRSETLPPTAFNPHDLFTGKRARLIEDAEESDEE
jgi:hypothetical protein